MVMVDNLIFILGDQLSLSISSLEGADPRRDHILMCEVMEETTYVRHHKKKITFILSSMRHFADLLVEKGFSVRYICLDDDANSGSFGGELQRAVEALTPSRVRVTEPGEWRVLEMMKRWEEALGLPVDILPDTRFLASHAEFESWAEGRRELRMEYFYREMRRKTGLLMRGDAPEGGRWNFDADNRKPARGDLFRPAHSRFAPDRTTRAVIDLVARIFPDHFGTLDSFGFAVTRQDALAIQDAFIEGFLPNFGETQDAMVSGDPFMNHSLLSFYINIGFLDPLDLCRAAERAYLDGRVPLNAAEGFIRQIIGWREYMRGIYWLKMPAYADSNALNADRPLPSFYWTGDTPMRCMSTVIGDTQAHAYAHHIQRLMITGNFAMLVGVSPRAIHEWYLEVYADAYEWVELPNVIGMSQFADGGLLGSKPYAAGGNYIARMSDYCEGCRYDVKRKTGGGACPFNALYWDFLARNHDRLKGNRRLATAYAAWRRMDSVQQAEYRASAKEFLDSLT